MMDGRGEDGGGRLRSREAVLHRAAAEKKTKTFCEYDYRRLCGNPPAKDNTEHRRPPPAFAKGRGDDRRFLSDFFYAGSPCARATPRQGRTRSAHS